MKVVFDLNIWIDIAARPKTYPDSASAFRALEHGLHALCFPLCAYTTAYYLMSRIINRPAALEFLETLERRGVKMLPFTSQDAALARSLPFNDHEDACVAATAAKSGCDCIITRNKADFSRASVLVLSPKEILGRL